MSEATSIPITTPSLLQTLRNYIFLPSLPKSFTVPGIGKVRFPKFAALEDKWSRISSTAKWSILLGGISFGLLVLYFRRKPPSLKKAESRRRRTCSDSRLRGFARRRERPDVNSVSQSIADSTSTSVAGALYRPPGMIPPPSSVGIGDGDPSAPSIVTVYVNSQQLCKMGHECLEQAVTYWEDALDLLEYLPGEGGGNGPPALPTADEARLAKDLQVLLERATSIASDLRENVIKPAEGLKILRHKSTVVSVASMDHLYQVLETGSTASAMSSGRRLSETSEADSFVSAISDVSLMPSTRFSSQETLLAVDADAELDLAVYRQGIAQVDAIGVDVRKIRTAMLSCSSDRDFLAKLVGVRQAFDELLSQNTVRSWFISTGRKIIGRLMATSDKDPSGFYTAYDEMIDYINTPDSMDKTWQELQNRNVKAMNFYDIVLDFIFLDAFDDLANPPGSVVSIIQNRWLSSGFKESALQTAVFYVLKAKRNSMKFPDGFMSHFYDVSEHVTPFLAWGFLGPDEDLNTLVKIFHDQLLGFIRDTFSYQRIRYGTLETMRSDIMKIAELRVNQVLGLLDEPSSIPSTPTEFRSLPTSGFAAEGT